MRKKRTWPEFEICGFWIENGRSRDVVGEKIGSALNPLERAAHALGKGSGEHGFGDSRNIFEQHMSVRKVRCKSEGDFLGFPNDHLLDILDQFESDASYDGFSSRLSLAGPGLGGLWNSDGWD